MKCSICDSVLENRPINIAGGWTPVYEDTCFTCEQVILDALKSDSENDGTRTNHTTITDT